MSFVRRRDEAAVQPDEPDEAREGEAARASRVIRVFCGRKEARMRKIGRLLAASCGALLTRAPVHVDRGEGFALPAYFASYQAWSRLLRAPHPVSRDLWALCRLPREADWIEERKRTGPHTEHLIMVYGNPLAAGSGSRHEGRIFFPSGAILA